MSENESDKVYGLKQTEAPCITLPLETTMKNKSFNTLPSARRYFNLVQSKYVCFLIENKEEGVYEVIDQDLYDHYIYQFNLDMNLIDMYA